MNRLPYPVRVLRLALSALTLMLLLTSCKLWSQSVGAAPSTAQGALSQGEASPQTAAPSDDLTQMRNDLNQMDSLLGNMSSEIEFLRDQNLQILLRTNAQMWRMLIRDLRQQVEREARTRPAKP